MHGNTIYSHPMGCQLHSEVLIYENQHLLFLAHGKHCHGQQAHYGGVPYAERFHEPQEPLIHPTYMNCRRYFSMKNMNKLMSLMIVGSTLRDSISPEEAKLISRYLRREN